MTFDLNVWHRAATEAESAKGRIGLIVERFVCKDGFNVSVQACARNYCTPRASKAWPYSHFELGFPSAPEAKLLSYAEDPDRLTETVYGYVPKELIEELILAHGGEKTA